MAAFGSDGRCLMRALEEELDDPAPADCGRCAVCTEPRFAGPVDAALSREAGEHLRGQPLEVDVKKMAPDAKGSMKRIPDEVRTEPGRALGRLGDSGWDDLVEAGKRAGRFDDELLAGAVALVRRWKPKVQWVAAIPSDRSGPLVPDFAARLAAALDLPFAPVVLRAEERPPQRGMENTPAAVENVRGAFAVESDLPPGPCLLVDDLRFSGWTLAMVGGQIRQRGCPAVYPLALSTAY